MRLKIYEHFNFLNINYHPNHHQFLIIADHIFILIKFNYLINYFAFNRILTYISFLFDFSFLFT